MVQHIEEKDIQDGKELMEILEELNETDLKQIVIYAGALRDRQLIVNPGEGTG